MYGFLKKAKLIKLETILLAIRREGQGRKAWETEEKILFSLLNMMMSLFKLGAMY